MFNLHFFVSGANKWVLMNGAIIAFIFAAVYNFYESYRRGDSQRFLLALIFLLLLPSNKYQSFHIFFITLFLGAWIQSDIIKTLRSVFTDRRNVIIFCVFLLITLLHFIKNWIATGWPIFPVYAGHLNIFNRGIERDIVFAQIARGVSWRQLLRYTGFLFTWSKMRPAFWVFIAAFFLPLINIGIVKRNISSEKIKEFSWWLAVSFFSIVGLCLANHQDPRYYVYAIGAVSFCAVFSWDLILGDIFYLRKRLSIIITITILFFSFKGAKIFTATLGASYSM